MVLCIVLTYDVVNIFACLLAICVSSSGKLLFMTIDHFSFAIHLLLNNSKEFFLYSGY